MRYHTLGTFHRGYWNAIAGHYLLAVGSLWFAIGCVLYALGRPQLRSATRLALLLLPILAVVLALNMRRSLVAHNLAERFDWSPAILADAPPYKPTTSLEPPSTGVPDGIEAGQELALRTHISQGAQPSQPERSVLLFYPGQIINIRQLGITEDNLTADLASATSVKNFLEQRDYQTALSWVAIKHLFNVAAVHLDTTTALQICMLDMNRCPHLSQFGQTTRAMLFTCAASPQNRAILDQWANKTLFAHPTRDSLKLIGDLYHRFGAAKEALTWYQRADMPSTFLQHKRGERPLYHQGRVTGTVFWNGKPLAGAQVGVVPHRLNGLPPDLEISVLNADRDLNWEYPWPLFPAYHPRPFSFRWISASTTTDNAGRFTIQNLTEGEYQLIMILPSPILLTPPTDSTLQIKNASKRIWLNYDSLSCDLGTIELSQRR
jgi:hypothetical protein